jgi:hypothetical protein
MSVKELLELEPAPEKITVYFCKECEMQTVAGNYQPASCCHCNSRDFWSEFDLGAPCNRQNEEEYSGN